MIKLTAPEKSLKLFKRAIQIAEVKQKTFINSFFILQYIFKFNFEIKVEDKYHEMMVFYESCIGLAIRIKDYNEALQLVNNIFPLLDRNGTVEQISEYILTVILIHLTKDDWVTANKYWNDMKSKYRLNFRFSFLRLIKS